jgi:MipA family protein
MSPILKWHDQGSFALAGFLAAFCASAAFAAEPPLWEAGAGIGVLSFPHYRGSNERRTWVVPVPYLVHRGDFLRADERRVRGLFFESEKADLDVSMNGTVPVQSSHDRARQGMPDLYPTLEIGPSLNLFLSRSPKSKLELRLPLRAAIASDFSHARYAGLLFQPTLNLDIGEVLGHWNAGLQGGPLFTQQRYNRYFYAVDPIFATADRPAYEPGGGYAGTQFIAALSRRYPRFWIGGFAKWDSLNGAVFNDSPLVKARSNFTAGFAVSWILGTSAETVSPAPR